MKIREHYIKFTGNMNNSYIIDKSCNTLVCFKNNYGSAILSVSVSLTTVYSSKENSQVQIRRLLHKGFAHFWHWLNCLEILFFFSFDCFLSSYRYMHRIAFVFDFDEEKSHLTFLHVWRIFFSPALSLNFANHRRLYAN